MTKLTDTKRFKLPYRSATKSARPGYLRDRMRQYSKLQKAAEQQTQRVVRPLRKAPAGAK